MNKTILGVAMVVVFCITWWLVAGEAWQVRDAWQAVWQAEQVGKQASDAAIEMRTQREKQTGKTEESKAEAQQWEAAIQSGEEAKQARQAVESPPRVFTLHGESYKQAEQASIMADAHWRTQRSWGIGAGLLADVLLLVGALAWSKLTAKP